MKPKITDIRFRDGFRLPRAVDAETAAKQLLKLHETHGDLTPEQVVKDATRPASPLHGFFEWDNDAAAEQYRLWQARHLLGSIMVTVERAGGESIPVRRFLHAMVEAEGDQADPEPRYMEFMAVLSDSDLRQQQLDLAMAELSRWAARWAVLEELDPCFQAIRRWQEKFSALDRAA